MFDNGNLILQMYKLLRKKASDRHIPKKQTKTFQISQEL